jgi:hypothetical protein
MIGKRLHPLKRGALARGHARQVGLDEEKPLRVGFP